MSNLDLRCMCGLCESRTKETYEMGFRCGNCAEDGTAIIRHGDKPYHAAKCPNCGVQDLLFYPVKHREIR